MATAERVASDGSWLRLAAAPLLALCAQLALAQAGPTNPVTPHTQSALGATFARYLAIGRSDVHITLAAAGDAPSARLTPRADGTFGCEVAGLNENAAHGPHMFAGLLIHEVTHCLTGPYTAELRRDQTDPVSAAANLLVLLTLESISDARAVIEIFRKDGADAAREYVAAALPARLRPASAGHATAQALHSALEAVTLRPLSVATDSQAFAVAVRIGSTAAARTFRQSLAAKRQSGLSNAPAVAAVAAQLRAALARAEQAFDSGRHRNDAATVRATIGATAPGDHHAFVAAGGALSVRPVLGAETAHELAELQTLIASSDAPEHRLALAWLQREGRLDAGNVARCRGAFARLIRAFSDGSPAQTAQALRVLGDTIAQAPPGASLSPLLEAAADALKSLRAASG